MSRVLGLIRGLNQVLPLPSTGWQGKGTGYPCYAIAKSSVNGLTRGLAVSLGQDRIRINTVSPGWVMTERQVRLWLNEESERRPEDQRLLQIIQKNSHRLDRMVQEVLYLNRRDRAHPEPIDAKPYLEQFVRDFCANEKAVAEIFVLSIRTTRRPIFDRSHLDQILWNLVRNARRHGRGNFQSVTILLRAAPDVDNLLLEIKDDGPGVSVEALAHLFEPFFTTDASGTGLGLYIARELAEVNGARLEYVAATLKGRADAAQLEAVVIERPVGFLWRRPCRPAVLVVDDELIGFAGQLGLVGLFPRGEARNTETEPA